MAVRPRKATSVDSLIASRLRELRVALGKTQHELAEVLGVTYQQVHRYEMAVNRISAAQLYEIACALNTPVAHSFEGVDQEPRALPPRERLLLDVARSFVEIQNEDHRLALCELVRTLAGS